MFSNTGKGYAAAIAASICTAAMFGIGKWIVTGISPVHTLALIFSIAAIVMGGWVFSTGQWRDLLHCSLIGWMLILLFSTFSVAAILTMWIGLRYLDPTVASFISRIEVLVAIMLGMGFLKERFRLLEGIGGLVVLIGLVVLKITFDVELSTWFWVMVLSAVLFGATEFIAKLTVRHLDPIPLTFIRSLAVAICFLIMLAIQRTPIFEVGQYGWAIIAIAIVGPVMGRITYLMSLKHIEISKASLITQSKPLFVAIIAFIGLGMIPSSREWIGGILILIGCATIIMTRPHHSRIDA